MWQNALLVAVAGAAGAVARYGGGLAVQRLTGSAFPWGTAAVNLLGCFLFGVAWALAEGRLGLSPQARLALLTGFLGAFTTFSTFAFDVAAALREGHYGMAAANLVLQNAGGVLLLLVGLWLGRWAVGAAA